MKSSRKINQEEDVPASDCVTKNNGRKIKLFELQPEKKNERGL